MIGHKNNKTKGTNNAPIPEDNEQYCFRMPLKLEVHKRYWTTLRVLCAVMATYAINTYREPTRLFIMGGKELRSVEGTTQGDPLAMSLYAVSLQPLITRLGVSCRAKQCWFADDATGAGSVEELKKFGI